MVARPAYKLYARSAGTFGNICTSSASAVLAWVSMTAFSVALAPSSLEKTSYALYVSKESALTLTAGLRRSAGKRPKAEKSRKPGVSERAYLVFVKGVLDSQVHWQPRSLLLWERRYEALQLGGEFVMGHTDGDFLGAKLGETPTRDDIEASCITAGGDRPDNNLGLGFATPAASRLSLLETHTDGPLLETDRRFCTTRSFEDNGDAVLRFFDLCLWLRLSIRCLWRRLLRLLRLGLRSRWPW